MNILIDMNLTPEWVTVFAREGWGAVHWSTIGLISAPDPEIMRWARDHKHVVFTHDLDFSTILAVTNAAGPSIIQVRGKSVLPEVLAPRLVRVMRRFTVELERGAIVVVNEARSRVRLLPLRPSSGE